MPSVTEIFSTEAHLRRRDDYHWELLVKDDGGSMVVIATSEKTYATEDHLGWQDWAARTLGQYCFFVRTGTGWLVKRDSGFTVYFGIEEPPLIATS
jgi:hypothetical protein